MRKLLLAFLLVVCAITCFSQSLKVKGMETAIFDLAAATNPRYDINGKVGALIKVQLPERGATFESSMILGDVDYNAGEYLVYMASGAKRLTIKYPHCLPLTVDFSEHSITALETKTTYVLQILVSHEGYSKFKKNRLYVEPQIVIGSLTAFGASMGGYINHINVEASYINGISKSEEIFWNDNSSADGAIPYSYTYKASRMGVRVGYGVNIGKYFCLTPQVGMGSLLLSGTEQQKGDSNPSATKGYATNMTIGAKMNYIFSNHFGVMITPEYSLAISKSNMFERVSEVSDKVKSFATGFNVRIGVFATF